MNTIQSMHKMKHILLQNLELISLLLLSTLMSVFVSLSWFLPFFCWGGVTTYTDCLFGVAIETHVSV